ncbi:MFS transporter [Paraburkholderia humisilvae]|uniref:2-nitroimidazole transporter n=1 Tax=Paraburkholderia humisilvae TaxID=627669 RepID=A0A6J5F965_9BURK|nr:MFS transporter [Paraburkholderia humisilvae]CAB3773785.1 2-nitroimidazole transporter [Paraburkholderia humisilvae]
MSHRDTAVMAARPALLIVGLLLVATNLRAPITGIAPVMETLESFFTLTPAQGGLLTTLPLLTFGIISPFASIFAREYGLERSIFGALLVIAGGVIVRSIGAVWCLYLGTAFIGAGIAVGNVLLPSLVKRDFPTKVPTITGTCAIAMGGAAALVSASAVPFGNAFGWRMALGATLVFPLVAMLVWSSQLGGHTRPAMGTPTPPHGGRVWHSALAWQVSLFMGVNSLLYYVLVAWLPSILTSAGLSPAAAGSIHGVMQIASAIPGLLLGPIVGRMKDQKLVAAAMGILMIVALLGFCIAPRWAIAWAFCFGMGSGGGVLLALIFMGLRAGTAHQAATLSGMAQCVGYLLAAFGPTLAGKVHDLTGSWTVALYIGVGLAIVMVIFGLLAGRSRTIGMAHPQASH